MARPTRRGIGMLGGASILFVVGTNVQAGWLFVLSSLLVGAALVGLVLPTLMVRGLVLERRAPESAFVDDDVSVDVVVRNAGRGTRLSLLILDPHIASATMFVPHVGSGEDVVLSTVRRASRRGGMDAPPMVVASSAPFGAGVARRRVDVPGRTVVYPRVVALRGLPAPGPSPVPGEFTQPLHRQGSGQEFFGVREYRAGDSLRHVHWPSTARHGALMVREFEREHPVRLAVVIDTLADTANGDVESALDVCCSLAASIIVAARSDGRAVELIAARGGALERLSDPDLPQGLTWLAELQPGGGLSLAHVLLEAAPFLESVQDVVLAMPSWDVNSPPVLTEAMSGLSGRGRASAAVVVDVATFPTGRRPQPSLSAQALESMMSGLRSAGVSVSRLGATDDVAACLDSVLRASR